MGLPSLPVFAVVAGLYLELVVLDEDGIGRGLVKHEVVRSEGAHEDGIGVDAEVVVGQAQLPKGELHNLLVDIAGADTGDRLINEVLAELALAADLYVGAVDRGEDS
ncbi:unannotated protein [freshwater metagenome]|uniref:Unannotated protein n=1 Tax=freshwater metagenome TaxID=449393 RepID=A0A6J7LL60_9ZZZZ